MLDTTRRIMHRATANCDNPAMLLTVTEIVVFGSYLDPAVDLLGDLGLAVSTARRDTDWQGSCLASSPLNSVRTGCASEVGGSAREGPRRVCRVAGRFP